MARFRRARGGSGAEDSEPVAQPAAPAACGSVPVAAIHTPAAARSCCRSRCQVRAELLPESMSVVLS